MYDIKILKMPINSGQGKQDANSTAVTKVQKIKHGHLI